MNFMRQLLVAAYRKSGSSRLWLEWASGSRCVASRLPRPPKQNDSVARYRPPSPASGPRTGTAAANSSSTPATNVGCPIQAVLWLEWDNGSRSAISRPPAASSGKNYGALMGLAPRIGRFSRRLWDRDLVSSHALYQSSAHQATSIFCSTNWVANGKSRIIAARMATETPKWSEIPVTFRSIE